jgi:hypothetical protein
MAMKNIESFDKCVGYVFGELYENFPICVSINLKQFLQKNKHDVNDKEELILSETLFWLRDNNFLVFTHPKEKDVSHFQEVRAFPQFSCVVLSAKGLDVLKKVPKSIREGKGIGEHIMEAVSTGAKEQLSTLVGVALSSAIGV